MIDPLSELRADRERARDLSDAHADLCTMATVDEMGLPQIRTLVLRDVGDRFGIFINATSPKQRQLATGRAALCVYFASLQRQYRLSGVVEAIPNEQVHASWHLRPDPPKRMDWYYMKGRTQSSEVSDRSTLLTELQATELPDPLEPPNTAVGYWLNAEVVERLDLAQSNGVHDRLRWQFNEGEWVLTTLVP